MRFVASSRNLKEVGLRYYLPGEERMGGGNEVEDEGKATDHSSDSREVSAGWEEREAKDSGRTGKDDRV